MKRSLLFVPLLALLATAAPSSVRRDDPEVIFAPTGGQRLIEKRISQELRAARQRILLAIYQFTSKDVAEALGTAKKRGLDVRVLVDGVQADGAGGTPYGEALNILSSAGVPVRKVHPIGLKNKGNAPQNEALRPKFHHKFCVIDGERVITGSYNWTVLADEENHENLLILGGAKLNSKYADQFEKIWKDEAITEGAGKGADGPSKATPHVTEDGPYVPPGMDPDKPELINFDPKEDAEVIFAPTGGQRLIEKRIVQEIQAAKQKVVLAIYQFTSKEIAEALGAAKKRGLDVRVLVDGVQSDGAIGTPYGEALKIVTSAGISVRKVHPSGLKGKNGKKQQPQNEALRPKFHHKFCAIDAERVITGSYNWTVLADEENHENLLVLFGGKLNAKYSDQFEKIWKDETITKEQP